MPRALKRFGFMMKGAKLIADVHLSAMKKKVPIYRNVKNLRAEGEERLTQVTATSGSKELSFDATTLLLSHHRLRPPKSLPFIFLFFSLQQIFTPFSCLLNLPPKAHPTIKLTVFVYLQEDRKRLFIFLSASPISPYLGNYNTFP